LKNKHTSLQFEKQEELTRTVQQYAAGLINFHKITPFEYPEVEHFEKFGDMSAKELQKTLKRKKLKKHKAEKFKVAPALAASFLGKQIAADELAQLAGKAEAAMRQAEKLAGKRVVYCCGNLRLEDKIDYECECGTRQRYNIINKL
jgi:hypothetical protein